MMPARIILAPALPAQILVKQGEVKGHLPEATPVTP